MRRRFSTLSFRTFLAVSVIVVILLAVRFLSSTALAAMDLSSETLASLGQVFDAYEILLPFPLLFVVVLLVASRRGEGEGAARLGILSFHAFVLIVWLLSLEPVDSRIAERLFPPLGTAAVAGSAYLALRLYAAGRPSSRRPEMRPFHFLLLLVPLVFAMRMAASLGVGTSPGEGGTLRGAWLFSNLPTLLLEFLAIGVWADLVLASDRARLRHRWYAFIPFAALPLALIGFELKPLSGYILSALITWGSNLALFVPASLSLGLAVTAVACYASWFLLQERRGNAEAWSLLLLGSSAIILAGFYLSMASVEGLSVALLLSALALSAWEKGPIRDPSPAL